MASGRNTTNSFISAAIFILLEIAAVAMLKNSSTLQNIWINRTVHRSQAAIWGWTEVVRDYFSLSSRNEDLRAENIRLSEDLRRLAKFEEAKMMADSTMTFVGDFSYIPAKVVRMGTGNQQNYIILNKGRADGIHPDCGIITNIGAVGIVEAVSEHYSYGLSLMNTNVSVSARIGRYGPVAPLVWDGRHTNKATLKDIPLNLIVSDRDTVWTSGHSEVFPEMVPIGVISNRHTVGGATDNIEVDMFQDFRSLRYVTVVEMIGRDEMTELINNETRSKAK